LASLLWCSWCPRCLLPGVGVDLSGIDLSGIGIDLSGVGIDLSDISRL
jgi:hypothetical protein